jgi:hypothetical protein
MRDHLEDLGVNEKIIKNVTSVNMLRGCGMSLKRGSVIGSCEYVK